MKKLIFLFFALTFFLAGFSQTVTNTVTLDGSGSKDEDGTITGWLWTKISGPAGDIMTGANTVNPKITYTLPGVYRYKLVVKDNDGALSTNDASVLVTVYASNISPKANAGSEIIIKLSGNQTSYQENKLIRLLERTVEDVGRMNDLIVKNETRKIKQHIKKMTRHDKQLTAYADKIGL